MQEVSKTSPDDAQSPEVSSHVESCVDDDTVRILTDKLSAALRKVRAKEDLVKQHAKVAEEAVSGNMIDIFLFYLWQCASWDD